VFDVLYPPAHNHTCQQSATLTTSSWNSSHPFLGIGRTVAVGEYREMCWLRASCNNCIFPAAANIFVTGHWSVQVMMWRFASRDALGHWSFVDGLGASRGVIFGTSRDGTLLSFEAQKNYLSLMPHVATDETKGKSQSSGMVVQDLNLAETFMRNSEVVAVG
jgi:hypothetical protein